MEEKIPRFTFNKKKQLNLVRDEAEEQLQNQSLFIERRDKLLKKYEKLQQNENPMILDLFERQKEWGDDQSTRKISNLLFQNQDNQHTRIHHN